MNKFFGVLLGIILASNVFAGNEQRAGQAGAQELLINPWARSAGWGGANSASIRGIESQFLNVAGISFTESTELMFTRTEWLVGTDISINAFGFSQKVGEGNVIGLSLTSMSFGDIEKTSVMLPDGGLGTFSPTINIISASYARTFSNSIFGGITLKVLNENPTADVSAGGVAIDAGIQYMFNENLQFGVSLKNVGPPMRYSGDGLSFKGEEPFANDYNLTVEHRSQTFEMPSLIKIGLTYNYHISEAHRLTTSANFTSNSFTNDLFAIGLEYGFKQLFMLRGGYIYEKGIFDENESMTLFTGPNAGFTIQIPLNKEKGSSFDLDYAYRLTNAFDGVHMFGAKLSL